MFTKVLTVVTLALGSRPRQGLAKARTKKEARVTFHAPGNARECEGMNLQIPKSTSILEVGVAVLSKMGSHDTFGHLKHKLWPKEGSGVKLAV